MVERPNFKVGAPLCATAVGHVAAWPDDERRMNGTSATSELPTYSRLTILLTLA